MVQVHQTSRLPFNTPSPRLKLAPRRGNADLKCECDLYFSLRGPFFRPQYIPLFPEDNGTMRQTTPTLRLKEYIFMNRDGLSVTVAQADSRIRPAEEPELPTSNICVLRTLCRVPRHPFLTLGQVSLKNRDTGAATYDLPRLSTETSVFWHS